MHGLLAAITDLLASSAALSKHAGSSAATAEWLDPPEAAHQLACSWTCAVQAMLRGLHHSPTSQGPAAVGASRGQAA